jgi:hypothetical protein
VQGRRKHKKVGGAALSRGTFGMERAPNIFFPEMLPTMEGGGGGGGGGRKNKAIINQRPLRPTHG